MRQTLSIALLALSVFVSVMVVSTGIAVQEQGLTSVAVLSSFNINNLEKINNDYYLKVEAVFENRAYTGAVINILSTELIVPALSESTAYLLIPVNSSGLISQGWLTKPVSISIRYSERILFAVFEKKAVITIPSLFNNISISTSSSGNYLIISFMPSAFTAGSKLDLNINGIQAAGNLVQGNVTEIKIPMPSQNDSLSGQQNYLTVSNFTYYFQSLSDL